MEDKHIEALILWKLRRRGTNVHLSWSDVAKDLGHKQHLGKDGNKRVTEVGNQLVKKGLLISKPAHYGVQVALNTHKIEEIKEILRKNNFPVD